MNKHTISLLLFTLILPLKGIGQGMKWEKVKPVKSETPPEVVNDSTGVSSGLDSLEFSNVPAPRAGAMIWHDKKQHKVYMHGGLGEDEEGSFGVFDDLWELVWSPPSQTTSSITAKKSK